IILSDSGGNQIGATIGTAGNVISGNFGNGINFQGFLSINNTVVDNFIGTNAAGNAGLANAVGVIITGGASSNVIGINAVNGGNVISGNMLGVFITGSGTDANTVKGNFIGVAADHTSALGNFGPAVEIDSANNNIDGNVIAFNLQGVVIDGGSAVGD